MLAVLSLFLLVEQLLTNHIYAFNQIIIQLLQFLLIKQTFQEKFLVCACTIFIICCWLKELSKRSLLFVQYNHNLLQSRRFPSHNSQYFCKDSGNAVWLPPVLLLPMSWCGSFCLKMENWSIGHPCDVGLELNSMIFSLGTKYAWQLFHWNDYMTSEVLT